jgi:hypothetical protein
MLEELQRRHTPRAPHTITSACRMVRATFQLLSGSFGSATHSPVSSLSLHQTEVVTRFGDEPSVCPAVSLHSDAQETVEHCRPSIPKKTHRLPTILSQEEVAQLIDAAPTAFYRTILMTLYATGVRNAELNRLKVSDIDSRRMVIHIQGGKGREDRDIMLSPVLLEELRAHWRRLRKKSIWLFPHASHLRKRGHETGRPQLPPATSPLRQVHGHLQPAASA